MSIAVGEEKKQLLLARHAMGTRFEMVLWGWHERDLRAAGEAALDEVEELDRRLSLFRRESLLTFMNENAHHQPVRLDSQLFGLLQACRDVYTLSQGSFDVTVGPFMAKMGLHERPFWKEGRQLSISSGFQHVELDEEKETVRFRRLGIRIDLGSIAKGFALELAGTILQEARVDCALLHGGTSTILALGAPPGREAWIVGIRDPACERKLLAKVRLRDMSLSVSAPHGRFVEKEGARKGHLIDPATGDPAGSSGLAAVAGPSPTLADAWSTAFYVAGPEHFSSLARKISRYTALLFSPGAGDRSLQILGPQRDCFSLLKGKEFSA